jgi:hypothetical protein
VIVPDGIDLIGLMNAAEIWQTMNLNIALPFSREFEDHTEITREAKRQRIEEQQQQEQQEEEEPVELGPITFENILSDPTSDWMNGQDDDLELAPFDPPSLVTLDPSLDTIDSIETIAPVLIFHIIFRL